MSALGEVIAAVEQALADTDDIHQRLAGVRVTITGARTRFDTATEGSDSDDVDDVLGLYGDAIATTERVDAHLNRAAEALRAYLVVLRGDGGSALISGEEQPAMGHMRTHQHEHDEGRGGPDGRNFGGPADKWDHLRGTTADTVFQSVAPDMVQRSAEDETGEEPVPKETRGKPEWLRNFDRGNKFNRDRRPYYTGLGGANEVAIGEQHPYKFLDSYLHKEEIVSRKHTQLAEVQEETAFRNLRELAGKYQKGGRIADTDGNREKFTGVGVPEAIGRGLDGILILEVPVQNQPVPQSILDEATRLGILIRDDAGKVYNPPKRGAS